MSSNIINTIGHHLFKYNPPEYTAEEAPFLAKNPEEEDMLESVEDEKKAEANKKLQFLGEGYYFWDNNINRAHRWGKSHYQGKYLIMEVPLCLQGDCFLDLVGSREDLMEFVEVLKEVLKEMPDLKIGSFFHMMQTMEKYEPGAWPYSVIRALNVKKNANKISFNHIQGSEMLLNPEMIICFYDKNELNLQNIRYINKNNKEWHQKT